MSWTLRNHRNTHVQMVHGATAVSLKPTVPQGC